MVWENIMLSPGVLVLEQYQQP